MTSIADVQRLLLQADATTVRVRTLAADMHTALQVRQDVIRGLRNAGMSYAEIGRRIGGLSRERVRQIALSATAREEVAA